MSILVSEVSKLYGEQKALDQVSFEIKPGEIVGFLGPNGAGKSTMMKIITCYLPQTEGRVEVCGFSVNDNPIEVKRKVGYLPEHNPLYLDMYVKEYLHFSAGVHQVKNVKERVDEMIALVGLQAEQSKKIGALSKGYRQRVGLAQAIIHDPEVLILDEPTSGLDPNQIVEIRQVIKRIGKEKTVMMSTHIMQEVEAVCDRVIIINKGKIVADDSAGKIKEKGSEKIALQVEFEHPVSTDLLLKIKGIEKVHVQGAIYLLQCQAGVDVRKAVFDLAVKQHTSVLAMQKIEQKLEDVFKELTK